MFFHLRGKSDMHGFTGKGIASATRAEPKVVCLEPLLCKQRMKRKHQKKNPKYFFHCFPAQIEAFIFPMNTVLCFNGRYIFLQNNHIKYCR